MMPLFGTMEGGCTWAVGRSPPLRPLLLLLLLVTAVVCSIPVVSGEVHELRDGDFDEFVANLPEEELLLVDFHKPSCRQCQKLSPVLDFLEDEWERDEPDASRRWFQLAKVDITQNTRLKEVFGIQRIPDLRFVRAGQWSTYEGGRTIEDFKEFKERMALVPLRFMDRDGLIELATGTEAVFVISADAGKDASSVAPGVLLAAKQLQHVATFCTTSPEVLSSLGLGLGLGASPSPALVKVVAGQGGRLLQPAVYTGEKADGIARASSWAVSKWVENQSFGLVSEFSPDNFFRLGSLGRLMVLGVVDPKNEATPSFEQAFGTVAAEMGVRYSDRLMFGTVNHKKMPGFVEALSVFERHPRVVVLDTMADVFYTVENMGMEVWEMEAFLLDVLAGYIPAQNPASYYGSLMRKIWWAIKKGGAWSYLLVLPVIALLWVFCDTPQREEAREALRQARKAEKEAALRLKTQ